MLARVPGVSQILRGPRAAIAAMFLVNGTLYATWVSRIPGIKDALALSDAQLGIALLCLGLGTFSSLPVTSWLIARHGSRAVVEGAALACCLALPLAGRAPSLPWLATLLVLFGATMASMDIAMNAQAAALERSAGRSIMASFHGVWSLGALAGAGLGVAFAARAYSPFAHYLAACAAFAAVAALAARGLVAEQGPPATSSRLAWPSRPVLAIGVVGACGAIVEGGIADWSGVFLRESLGTGAGTAAGGFAAFSLAMTFGRFGGDRLIDRFGRRALLRAGAALTAVALASALVCGSPVLALAAFAVAGLGTCTVFPIAFSSAAALPGQAPGHAIAAVATMAYGGGLLGPPAIGFVAAGTSLPVALSLLVLACASIAALAGRLPLAARLTLMAK